MWIVAGLLLGSVVLTSLVGFHTGPHSHAVSGVIGFVAAAWLIIMAFMGHSAPLLWALLSADLVVSAGVATIAWKGLTTPAHVDAHTRKISHIEGENGVVTTELAPKGVVRVRGESWSATSLNGTIPVGAPVQVVDVEGISLRVWGVDVAEQVPSNADTDGFHHSRILPT